MRIVVALGGNALLHRGEPLEAEVQRRNVQGAAEMIAQLASEHEVIVTHGNGPQVGLLALEAEAYRDVTPYPLDVLGAESQGMIGYLLLESLGGILPSRGLAGIITRVMVDENDPAFDRPTKPVGPVYGHEEATRLASERGWTIARDGKSWRRVVPSPAPLEVLDLQVIRLLVDAGITVVCGGGGGIPLTGSGSALKGVEGVIDKDLTSTLIALGLGADLLLLLTDVAGVARDWGTGDQSFLETATPDALRGLDLAEGSMGPKVEAACRFVEGSGREAAIGALVDAHDVLLGKAGTRVVPSSSTTTVTKRSYEGGHDMKDRHFPSHLLTVGDLDAEQLTGLLDLAAQMKEEPGGFVGSFRGDAIGCYFEKPSTRTRVSFEVACARLGLLPIMLRPEELQLGRGETIGDTAAVMSRYVRALVMRVFSHKMLEDVAGSADIPVVNALSDEHHPCQALADLLTIRERFGTLAGLKLVYSGDANNVAHSLMEGGALSGMHVVIAAPMGYRPDPEIEMRAADVASRSGGSITVTEDPYEAAAGANVVYSDVFVSMGDDDEAEERRRVFARYQVTQAMMELADPSAIFMHCLPAHRGQEVTAEVIDGTQSVVFDQAANRMPTEEALLYALLRGGDLSQRRLL